MTGFKGQLINEKDELFIKAIKLKNFISKNSAFKSLPRVQRALLKRQLKVMQKYLSILTKRINLLEKE